MPCPNCGKNIKYLICNEEEHHSYKYDGHHVGTIHEEVTQEFTCPECGEVVAEDFSVADEILGITDDLYRKGNMASTG
jgi:predicted RNA-binding Zn-ribbon protein involved in translation (DUF1610 family)